MQLRACALIVAALAALAACDAPAPSVARVEARLTSDAVAVPVQTGKPLPPASAAKVVQLAAGFYHACALHADRTVSCWGSNHAGQIADHATARKGATGNNAAWASIVALPAGGPLGDVLEIAAGRSRTCARRADGVWCWGAPVGPPEQVATLTDAVEITTQCARTATGQVWCWGDTLTANREPHLEPAIDLTTFDERTCTLADGGAIMCIAQGGGARARLNEPERTVPGAVEIALDPRDLCARRRDGTVWCIRLEYHYDGRDDTAVAAVVDGVTAAAQLALGDAFGCVRTRDRTVRCWGAQPWDYNAVRSAVVRGVHADELVAGHAFACARDGGDVWCWGEGTSGVLGNGWAMLHPQPLVVPGIDDAVDVQVGYDRSCVRRASGQVWCWGGARPDGSADLSGPVELVAARGAIELAGTYELCARFADGAVKCGTGTVLAPVAIRDAIGISHSRTHLVATMPDGGLMSFGTDYFGQFGTGKALGYTLDAHRAKDVTGVVGSAAGDHATCVIRTGGTVWCLGRSIGALLSMENEFVILLAPSQVSGIEGAVEVVLAGTSACARIADGTVRCWGAGHSGQLGQPMNAVVRAALPVPGLTDVVQLAGEGSTMCARRRDRTIACWGSNTEAIVGEPSAIDWADHPVVHAQTDVVDLSVAAHACAVLGTGAVTCWGMADKGQLGSIAPPDRATPVRVVFPTPR